jgi:diamine N-acetyltransferase
VLKAKNVELTSLDTNDLPTLMTWINEREQVLFNAPYKPVHESQHQAWFESIQKRSDMVIFGIRLVQDNKLIGSCQLHSIDNIHRSAELQIRIGNTSQRGRGYGFQAVRLLLKFAFDDLNLNRVYLHVFSTNATAIRLYEKAGFTKEGTLREAAHINGEYIDVIEMGIVRDEYKP